MPLTQEVLHNMYNIQSLSTCRYDSGDELKSNSSMTDDEFADEHPQTSLRYPSKHGSLDRRRHGSGEQHEGGYRSLERNSSAPIILPELQPSKYGSKRESTTEYNDAKFHLVEMPQDGGIVFQGYSAGESDTDLPPPPPPIAQQYGHGPYGDGSYPPPPPSAMHSGNYPPPPPPHHGEQRQPGDGSGSHPASGYSQSGIDQQWYESGIKSGAESSGHQMKQANPPRTPVYETPPLQFVQQDPPPVQQTYAHTESQQMTVTKFQSYVEVSKPFEMSDFYKYSEKLRKQRTVEKRQQKLEAVLAGHVIPSPRGTPDQRGQADGSVFSSGTPSPQGAGAARYQGYPLASPSSPGSMSPSGSTYSSASGSGTQGQQGSPALQHRSSRSSSPYTDGSGYRTPSSPNPGASYPTRGVRGPAAASYGIHSSSTTSYSSSHSSYHSHQMTYQSSCSMVTPPTKQIVYQPLAPQSCMLITQSPNTNTSNNTTPNR